MSAQQSELVCNRIIENFLEKLQPFGLDRFYYCIIPDELSNVCIVPDEQANTQNSDSNEELHFAKMIDLKKMRFAVASDPEILKFREEFLHRFARSDEGYQLSGPSIRKRYNPYIWPENTMPERRKKSFEQLLNLHKIRTRMSFYHPVKDKKGWIGICNLFSCNGREEIIGNMSSASNELETLLREFAETFNALAFKTINPISNFRVLSPTCVEILSLVAQGCSSEEVGKQLYMSERGVNYHIDRARVILTARNRTNLVSKAYQSGLL
ncbi:response regulator transcription factor [Shewanella atlantica]|uniref:LuxR family transcriptional regulator n=1 Tax=Shewanella atlantica TaxID=271099 RepID=A0A3S0IFD4_9GAMM|nr:helix-turn-helix transcriptional regulator [Shewanella atlantica]RTR31262.1 LuxR family transcriptional regulator [Shewanella atlantica]